MLKFISIITLTFIMSGCAIYRIEVQQGNALSNDTVSQLQRGMSKAEVASLLGNSLLQDIFRSNRWDYVYYKKHGKDISNKQSLTLIFQNDQLVEVRK